MAGIAPVGAAPATHDHATTAAGDDAPKASDAKATESKTADTDAAAGADAVGDAPKASGADTGGEQARAGADATDDTAGDGPDAPAERPTSSTSTRTARTAAAHGDGGHDDAGHAAEPKLANSINRDGSDPRFLDGTRGPVVPEGDAPTVKIPDGDGFDGEAGRTQNANDKEQNNYSVTDANYNPALGLLARNPDTGEPLNYNEHTATYNAAGFVKSTAEWYASRGDDRFVTEYNKIVANQDAGNGTILGATAHVMQLFDTPDPALEGVDVDLLRQMAARIPGTGRSGFDYVRSSDDATGQAWARMHHPESSWDMYYRLHDLGVPGETALRFSGDDGVSGAGRLNGYNNQDGDNGFNAGEVEIWSEAARYEQRTGLPIIQAMMSGHDHTGLDASAKTTPNANDLLGLAAGDVSASPARAALVRDGLLSGLLAEKNDDGGGGGAEATGGGNDNPRLPAIAFRAPTYLAAEQLHSTHIDPQFLREGDPRFVAGSVGPIVPEGEAQTIDVPDGVGFFGLEGRQQNAGDRAQNNYSVTDANFSPLLGLMMGSDGQPLNYVQQIQLYSAAGYLEVFAPEIYALLVALQDAGGITVLEGAAYILGILDAPEAAGSIGADRIAQITAAMEQAGIGKMGEDPRIPATIPGTNMDAKTYVLSTTDATGQEWARPHHPQSAFAMLKNLLANGVPPEMAFVLAGDDAVSGSGRLNGFNNQDGDDSFNADEAAVFRLAAEYEGQTGIPVVQIMMSGHDHTGLHESAMTDPNINAILGLPKTDRSGSPQRAAALSQALLEHREGIDIASLDQHRFTNEDLLAGMRGAVAPLPAPTVAATGAVQGAALVAGGGGMTAATAMATAAGSVMGTHAH